jgi:hypothetical protein
MRSTRLASLAAGLAALLATAGDASAQFLPGLKTHFFKPEHVKQTRIALPRAGANTLYLMVYLDPPVNGDGALAWVIPCPCDELQRTLEFAQLAQLFESGAIKGVAYAPDEPNATTVEHSSVYFDQPASQHAYRIKGLFFSEAGKMQMLQPMGGAVMLPAQPAGAVKLAGTWKSNHGVVYEIAQSGGDFSWTVASLGQKGNGTLNGKQVSASWQDAKGSGSATGEVVQVDPDGAAREIRWSNGVVFKRP